MLSIDPLYHKALPLNSLFCIEEVIENLCILFLIRNQHKKNIFLVYFTYRE